MNNLQSIISKVDIINLIQQDFELRHYSTYAKGVIHDSLVVLPDKNIFYWNSLGISGNALDWLTKIKGLSTSEAIRVLKETSADDFTATKTLPIERNIYPKLLDIFWQVGLKHRDYWYSKGYNDATIDKFKLGFTGRCYVIPILFGGNLYNFQCKIPANGDIPKRIWNWATGLGILPFNFDALSDSSTVFIIESPGDAINVSQLGLTAISQTGGASSWNKEFNQYLIDQKEIIICYDNDYTGLLNSIKLAKFFEDRARILFWPFDFSLKYGVGDLIKDFDYNKSDFINFTATNTFPLRAIHPLALRRKFEFYGEV